MPTKVIASTEAQNNFGRILDDAIQNDVRYVIRRRNMSQAILLSLSDLEKLLSGTDGERQGIRRIIKDLCPIYDLGDTLDER
jgi:predicted transcriptional regulator